VTLPAPPVLGPAAQPADLLALAHGAASTLAERGIGAGDRIAVLGDGGPHAVLGWLLGADLLGAATLVVEPRWSPRERAAVLDDARPAVVVGGAAEPADTPIAASGNGRTAFYLPTTSGSSGRAKVLVRSRDSWLRSFAALGPLPGPVLIAGPLSSSLFLFGALHALWCGAGLALRPRLHAADVRGAGTVHVVPAMLADLLDHLEHGTGPRTVVCGGAHLDDGLRARFARVLPDSELIEYYGSAEHSLIAVRRGTGELRPVPGVELDVRDGTLWVRSPLAFAGYLRSGRLEPAAGWTSVGDRVERTASGGLIVHGRSSATISSGGRLVAAEEVEAVLRAVPGVDDVLVTGTPHRTYGALVTAVIQAERPPSLRALRAAARAGLEPGKRPRRWLAIDALPRTAAGKPARGSVAEQLVAGTFPARRLS
jgi:long-chain acyl-CoA synthetase